MLTSVPFIMTEVTLKRELAWMGMSGRDIKKTLDIREQFLPSPL